MKENFEINPNSEINSWITTQEQRRKHWQELVNEVNQIKDRLGEGIDEDIKETVVALKALNINTSQSCEGHEGDSEHSEGSPYVDISSPDIEDLEQSLNKLLEISSESAEVDELIETISNRNKQECAKATPLLEEFYSNRTVDPKVKLGVHFYDLSIGRLESEGVNFREKKNNSVLPTKQELESYRKEMKDFKNFLEAKYLANNI